MSCGEHHETDCRDVLDEVYLYLDLECSEDRRALIRTHLDECNPCLRQYGIEQEVKALVARCCGAEKAPTELRDRLRLKLTELTVEVDRG
ncbi:mycothiol system anti-sigma-R factor [Spirilliplanes yamanashiensis]|uniref:Anti-sigma factor RsrA n=1 Tax=Spirilliplanes yamanashiensis TaxID=42233 RepID=A0A8J3Y456_9ACTN|nr:mycothiol system anti-sigma-R factor [Spirilliplanes yamanashiensis]MDP9820120.1 mycothiol system anti-sigma-R factor [Spirilliplanes yamanashiensis]GIJ01060.1 anti-sigma factor RsrA [Spirilliplanes yamanashiensis]